MNKVYILSAKRTAIGKFLGTIANVSAADLGATVIKDILSETKIDPALLDEVIVGNVLCAGQKQGIARQASVKAGIPVEVPAYGINMICGSGMKSVLSAYNSIKSGEADLILAGGTESMSGTGFVVGSGTRQGHKMGNMVALDHMVCDGLTDAFTGVHMGITAENIAEKYNISREEQDSFSYKSQQKAIAAIDKGVFKEEIVPVVIESRKGTIVFDTDEFPNRASTPEKLAALKPAFKKDGTVTAGNASGLNDGASFLLIASEAMVNKLGIKPLAEIVATGQAGVDPNYMGMGPVPAIGNVLKKSGYKLSEIDLIELNEAFAAQSLAVIKELCKEHNVTEQWFMDRANVNGGALALGHPIGASGNRIIVTLLHEMGRRNHKLGLASLCIGGGMGTSVILKME
ncbi:acetyl-CoA C-acetyltransferase [Dysgonomonas sp. PH5-45]|uniref:acetyl-CoA C-acetyltransferase n=1 Tax=unclassified Dysgonomonas TaxID=2630389 RepID=UPI002474FE20|nr:MULTISPECIES: acetyl-CoA C-acetyltransferase [unclassified Dysgonomonas]MDH6353921.1 acetyl-CoA C-acetyltransferase [Dysgonomonas sp. PH5-45]MDH6386823.1 acetyl-CoA C-acetyltransferase [Dysgonomonas sp. PH5-37]